MTIAICNLNHTVHTVNLSGSQNKAFQRLWQSGRTKISALIAYPPVYLFPLKLYICLLCTRRYLANSLSTALHKIGISYNWYRWVGGIYAIGGKFKVNIFRAATA